MQSLCKILKDNNGANLINYNYLFQVKIFRLNFTIDFKEIWLENVHLLLPLCKLNNFMYLIFFKKSNQLDMKYFIAYFF